MKSRHIVLCVLMILAAAAATAYYAPGLRPTIPLHWNSAGQVDGYGPRWILWLIGPGLMAVMLLIGVALPWLSPKQFEVQRFAATYSYLMTVLVVLFGGLEALMISTVLSGVDVPGLPRVLEAGGFLLLVLIGNPMGKVRRNFFIGIRTPWTLASEQVWNATHRLAGKLMVASGVLGLLAVWLNAPGWILLVPGLGWALVAAVYSLVRYKRLEAA